MINNNVDELDVHNPISRNIVSDTFFNIDPLTNVYRQANIYLNEVNVNTDYGYLPTMMNRFCRLASYTFLGEFREQAIFTVG